MKIAQICKIPATTGHFLELEKKKGASFSGRNNRSFTPPFFKVLPNQFRVVIVSGDGPNYCGHALLNVGGGEIGYYFHVAGWHDYPSYMTALEYAEYLKINQKHEIGRIPVHVRNKQVVLNKLNQLMSQKWLWLVTTNNCYTFVEKVLGIDEGNAWLSTLPSSFKCPVNAWGKYQVGKIR